MHSLNRGIVLTAATTLASPALGQSVKTGTEAYNNGNYAIALKHFEPLAEEGDADAQYTLGLMYDLGEGFTQNSSTAAEQGHADAQYKLGVSYYSGDGLSRNPVMANVLNNLAAAQWHDQARQNRDAIANELSRKQLTEGQRIANEWRVRTPLPALEDISTWP